MKNPPKWEKFAKNSGKEMGECRKSALVSKIFCMELIIKIRCSEFLMLEETKH